MRKKFVALILALILTFTLFPPDTLAANADITRTIKDYTFLIRPAGGGYAAAYIVFSSARDAVVYVRYENGPRYSFFLDPGSTMRFNFDTTVEFVRADRKITDADVKAGSTLTKKNSESVFMIYRGYTFEIFDPSDYGWVKAMDSAIGMPLFSLDAGVIPAAITPPAQLPITMTLNGKILTSDVSPFIYNGRTMVPVRFISEAFGANVDWNADEWLVTITAASGTVIKLKIGFNDMSVNGIVTTMDIAATIIDNRTFVPVRFIAEALGLKVGWNEASRTVSFDSP